MRNYHFSFIAVFSFLLIALYTISTVAYEDLKPHLPETRAIEQLVAFGVLPDASGNYQPHLPISRVEFLSLAFDSAGITMNSAVLPRTAFNDVRPLDWYAPIVSFAQSHDLLEHDANAFAPLSPITRAEAVSVLAKLYNIPNADVDIGNYPDVPNSHLFSRMIQAFKDRNLAVTRELGGFFGPDESLTRGEAAEMVYRLMVMKSHNLSDYRFGLDVDDSYMLFSRPPEFRSADSLQSAVKHVMPSAADLLFLERDVAGNVGKKGGASAVAVNSNGLFATSKHVVDNNKISERTFFKLVYGGNIYDVRVVAKDPIFDLALIEIDASSLPVTFADHRNLLLGDPVFTIGNALGEYESSLSHGVVTALNRTVIAKGDGFNGTLAGVIQTDMNTAKGFSGGGLYTERGEFVGMNSAIDVRASGVSFATPAMYIKQAVDSYAENGRIDRPYYGMRFATLEPEIAIVNGLTTTVGAIIVGKNGDNGIVAGSPAEKAGLQLRDVILSFDGVPVTSDRNFLEMSTVKKPGDVVTLEYQRDGNLRTTKLEVGSLPSFFSEDSIEFNK